MNFVKNALKAPGEPRIKPAQMRVLREFEHGAADCLTQSPLFIGCRGKIEFCPDSELGPSYTDRGLALAEIEFLTRHHGTYCVYARATGYLPLLARLFPAMHFYAFECEAEQDGEYDPAAPAIRCRDYGANVTPSAAPVSRENIAGLRGPDALVLHPSLSAERQLLVHTLLRPRRTLFSLCGDVPDEYVSGRLVYPLYTPVSSSLVHLVAQGHGCVRLYYPTHLRDELGYFQV